MDRMIAYCGLICSDCPAYEATKADDLKKAEETAELWSKHYGVDIAIDDVWCDGCPVEGKKCSYCAKCAVRACADERDVIHCGACPDYACEKISEIIALAPQVREVLEEERK